MAKYHINPETGRPNLCTANVKCKFSKDGVEVKHYDSKEDAREDAEKMMKNKYGDDKVVLKKKVHNDSRSKLSDNDSDGSFELKKVSDLVRLKSPGGNVVYTQDSVGLFSQKEYFAKKSKVNDCFNHDPVFMIDTQTEGVSFNEGTYYYPAPAEDWHSADISYTTKPSFAIKDKKKFLKNLAKEVPYDVKDVIANNDYTDDDYDNLVKSLDEVGFFDGSQYSAHVENHYYGDEFFGSFDIDKEVSDKAADIFTSYHLLSKSRQGSFSLKPE